jgi:hypothetical protein
MLWNRDILLLFPVFCSLPLAANAETETRVFALLKRALPAGKVSRLRYNIGLGLLIPHVIFAYLTFYAPHWLPGYDEHRVTMNMTADFLLVITLFILGGEFWEKLRALFIYDAKAGIPKKS